MDISQQVLNKYAGSSELSTKNADPNNWEWDKTKWVLADRPWQDLKRDWYGAEGLSVSPSLSLPFLEPGTILVRDCYVTTFDRIWARAFQSEGKIGTIVTGQPGTGKTLFLYYLLVRLLQQMQKVLFSPDGDVLYLFNNDHVYESSTSEIKTSRHLPRSKTPNGFLWSLFDIREATGPKAFLTVRPCLPVQATSPDPNRYKIWRKERRPLLTALPLWTHREFVAGLQFQDEYQALREALDASTLEELRFKLSGYPGVFEVLQEYQEDDENLPSPADALMLLLENAIHHFGYSARDVYNSLFDYQGSINLHKEAFNQITHDKLREAIAALASGETLSHNFTHEILAISPIFSGPFSSVTWKVDFKSECIAECIIEKLGAVEDIAMRQLVAFLRGIPGASGVAERFFEPIVHRLLTTSTDDI